MGARKRVIGGLTAVLVGAGMLAVPGGATAAPGGSGGPRFTVGAAGAGDAYFPYAGNGGYDVQHYDLDITYTPPAPAPAPLVGQLAGVATIDLVATQDLDRFNLDLRGMAVQAITINGKTASEMTPPAPGAEVEGAAYWHVQNDAARVWELTIQPRPNIKKGQGAQIVVAYGGQTTRPEDIEGVLYGWVTQRDGAMVVGDLVPSQRPSDRQGNIQLRDHRAGGEGRGRQRAARTGPDHGERLDHLVLGGPGLAGQLPDHGLGR
jgi:hypothetical protein